jgi:hypothetical protein
MLKGWVLAFAGFLLFLVLHVVLFRIRVPKRRFIAMVKLEAVVVIGLIGVYLLTSPTLGFLPEALTGAGRVVDLSNMLLVSGFLFTGYCMFYALVDRGFSGRIMIEVSTAPGGRLRATDIASRYSLEQVLMRRLTETMEIGRIELSGGRYRVTAKGRRMAALFFKSKRFLRLGDGG